MKISQIVAFTIVVLSLFSCTKDIKIIPSSSFKGQLYIESLLYPDKAPRVYLSRSLPFFDPSVTPQEIFARGATVTISSSLGTETLLPDSTFDKFRCRWVPYYEGSMSVQYGESYDLMVDYEGKIYNASTTINQDKVDIEKVEYIAEFFDIFGGHDGVIITLIDPEGPGNFYRFQMNRTVTGEVNHVDVLEGLIDDCTQGEVYAVTDLGRIVFSDENVDGQRLELLIEVAFEYVKDDSTYVFIQSLDRNSAEFFIKLDEQSQAILNPFIEPIFLESKIDGAIGFFGSAVLSDSVLFVYPVTGD